jgi:hypothetical protein
MLCADQGSFRKRSKWSFRKAEVDAPAVLSEAYAVGSSDGREYTIRTVVGAGCTRSGELTESGGLHLDHRESVSGNRFGEVPIHRVAVWRFHNGCFHLGFL